MVARQKWSRILPRHTDSMMTTSSNSKGEYAQCLEGERTAKNPYTQGLTDVLAHELQLEYDPQEEE